MRMLIGTVSWYDSESKHGKIETSDGTPYRIQEFTKGVDSLRSGQTVAFALATSSTHPIVTDVVVLGESKFSHIQE